jgi:predicted ribosome quality control (RQC) complex YloA/Tae2 family protein
MINNYYTLKYVAENLNSRLNNFEIVEIFSQNRNELIISLSQENLYFSLQISVDPSNNYILLRDAIKKAKSNSISLFPELTGFYIEKISISPSDRIIEIMLQDTNKIIITFFRGESNIYHICNNKILQTFKKSKDLIGQEFHIEKREFNILKYLHSSEELQSSLRNVKEKNIYRTFNKILPSFGTSISKEIMFRANIDHESQVLNLSNIDLNYVWQKFKEIYGELNNPKPQVYFENDRPLEFSIIELTHLEEYDKQYYTDIFEGIAAFLFQRRGERSKEKKRDEMLRKIDNEILFFSSSISKLENEIKIDRSEEYQRNGEIIMSNLDKIEKGQEAIETEDMQEKGAFKISIDPTITPVQNATYYFNKAKKASEAKRIALKRLDDVRLKSRILSEIFNELQSTKSLDEYNSTLSKHRKDLEFFGIVETEEKQKEISLFRRFVVEGGFEVLCGKNSENNDLLTFKYTKQDDLWFHARGAGGSHVVLKVSSGKGEPDKKAINQAASIAAYYSQARGSSVTPVAMTKKKWVRKPKGAMPGTVVLQQEKVVFAEPKLPG